MQPTRRAFLFGRGTRQTPWQTFCQRLRRSCQGRVEDAGETGGEGVCRLQIAHADDARHALALCTEYGVVLALAGVGGTGPAPGRSVLWVDPSQLRGLVALDGPVPRWRAGPGVTLAELTRAGLPQFASAPPSLTLGEWFADPYYAAWPIGRVDLGGIHCADVLLAGGEAETFGPFGAEDGQPLRSATLQRLVPALFLTSARPDARWCRAQAAWPARYRIDALAPVPPATVNLAHVLHGHGGTLAWVDSLVLQVPAPADAPASNAVQVQAAEEAAPAPSAETAGQAGHLEGSMAVRTLEGRIKSLFDPMERYAEVLGPAGASAA